MNRLNSRREGFALAAAVLAMLVVGAIVTGGFYAASQQGSIAKSVDASNLAFYIAESGLNKITATASASTLNGISVGGNLASTSATNAAYNGNTVGNYTWNISRVSQWLYVVSSTGTVTLGGPYSGAQRSLATLARLRRAQFNNNTALQVYGNLTVGGSSEVDTANYRSAAWSSCPTAPSSPTAVTANPTSTISTSGSGSISGGINYQAMDSTDFNVFGDVGFDELASVANYRYTSTVTVGPVPAYTGVPLQCYTNISTQDNWGAPTNAVDPCFDWFPVIYAQQDLHISSGGTGQGVLLVEGNLDVSGGFTFYGVVVVRGTITMTGTGGHINGTLITYGDGSLSSTSTTLGNSTVQYSSCGIERAVLGNPLLARIVPVANRSWLDLSTIQNSY